MADVVAKARGFFGGAIREPGDRFHVPDEIWSDPARRPRWAAETGRAQQESAPQDGTASAARVAKARGRAQQEPRDNGLVEGLGGPPPAWPVGGAG